MDGDGSIQVNHWRNKSLQFRLVIKLSNLTTNYNMLIKIAKVIGGSVLITGKGKEVIWVVNKKQEVEEIIKIYDTYPPLTSKKICQLAFLKTCLTETSVKTYLFNRNLKYNQQLTIINSNINTKNRIDECIILKMIKFSEKFQIFYLYLTWIIKKNINIWSLNNFRYK